MKNIIGMIVIISSLFLVGCGGTVSLVSQPKKGDIETVNVGESIYTYYYGRFNRRAKLINNSKNIEYGIEPIGVRFDPLDGHKCALHIRSHSLFDYNCDGRVTHDREGNILPQPLKYTIFPHPNTKMGNVLNHIVLYQGRIGNKIKVSYREFVNNLARPSFTQDIEYQLNRKGQALIGFKGIQIKVLRATNMDIKYKIIKEFN